MTSRSKQLALWTPEHQERSGATISPCGLYRWHLWRSWGDEIGSPKRAVNFVMLNPSTADHEEDDPTIRRCIGFARSWGYDGIKVTNLYAFRATKPLEMRAAADPIGNPGTDLWIKAVAKTSELVVCAWGVVPNLTRTEAVIRLLLDCGKVPHTLRWTAGGHPAHPLYLPGNLEPFPMFMEGQK